jgi:hypothetical protein
MGLPIDRINPCEQVPKLESRLAGRVVDQVAEPGGHPLVARCAASSGRPTVPGDHMLTADDLRRRRRLRLAPYSAIVRVQRGWPENSSAQTVSK